MTAAKPRLAIIATHPIQYYAPWFANIQSSLPVQLKVFYLWDGGSRGHFDPGFGQTIRWDIPLLEGYQHAFIKNVAATPGTHNFFGLDNPDLLRQLKGFRPDAVLCTAYRYKSIASLIMSGFPEKVPFILRGDSHLLNVNRFNPKYLVKKLLLRSMFKHFTAALFVGSANRKYLRNFGFSQEQLFFVPHAVNLPAFSKGGEALEQEALGLRRNLKIPDQHTVVAFIGKLENKKRPLDLLEAFKRANLENCSLLFVGSGELEAELKAQAGANTYFMGFQNQSVIPAVHRMYDLLVLPSYGNYETWGLVVNEARACKKAVLVSSHVGCAQDLVKPNKDGLVFKAGNIETLKESLIEACSDKEQLREWGQAGGMYNKVYCYPHATAGLWQSVKFARLRFQSS